jgi:hypothetical protein
MLRRSVLAVALVVALVAGVAAPAAASTGFGGAPTLGHATGNLVAVASTPTSQGYWEATAAGGVFAFGDAAFHGSAGGLRLQRPVVGMAATPTGRGYWLTASDGGIFAFGDAAFHGSTGGRRLNRPIVGMAATPTGRGYWLTADDGGIFAFGDAAFHGSGAAAPLPEPVVGIAASPTGAGYRLATRDGRALAFGDATDAGSRASACKDRAIVAIASTPAGGYLLAEGPLPFTVRPASGEPVPIVAAESANIATLLRLRQGCQPAAAPREGVVGDPLPGARVTEAYGWRTHPVHQVRQFHTGIDVAGGTAIHVASDGVVLQIRDREGYGRTTVIDHGNGVATVYGHQAATHVAVGTRVTRGQVIGTAGRTGYATGVHLHFEVRVHGEPTDPLTWR